MRQNRDRDEREKEGRERETRRVLPENSSFAGAIPKSDCWDEGLKTGPEENRPAYRDY